MIIRQCLSDRFRQIIRLSLNHSRFQSTRRTNPLGIQMLSTQLHQKLFPSDQQQTFPDEIIKIAEKHLKQFELGSQNTEVLEDIDFTLPNLESEDLNEHFKVIAQKQSAPYAKLIRELMEAKIPAQPKEWIYAKGWTKFVSASRKDESYSMIFLFEDISIMPNNQFLSPTPKKR